MDKKIQNLLDQQKIKFKLLEHRKVYTAFNEAETQHVDPKTVAKTVLIKLSKNLDANQHPGFTALNFVLVTVPAKKRVDLKKIAKAINDRQAKNYKTLRKANPKLKAPAVVAAKLAGEKDITQQLKTKVGLLHPFGSIFKLPALLDKSLVKSKKFIVSAGSYTESLEITVKDYLKSEQPLEGSFT